MNICLYLDPTRARRWHLTLIDRLQTKHKATVTVVFANASPNPDFVEFLIEQECDQLDDDAAIGSERIELTALPAASESQEEAPIDWAIDLVGDGACPAANATVCLLFNGHVGEHALIASIMQSGLPQIALRNSENVIVATAQPSAELAVGVSGSMDQTYARVITLLSAYLGHQDRWVQPLIEKRAELPSQEELVKRGKRERFKAALKQIYYRLFRASHWRIGWRWVENEDVWSRHTLSGESWQVLDDEETHFYADPVPWTQDGRTYLFFEDLDHETQKGIISVVEFGQDGKPGPAKPCLEEDYHLSYPFLLTHEGETYMIPETSGNRDVALYKATNFPFGWERHKVIMTDIDAADVTITQHDGKWWIFCVTRDGAGGYSDCLSIFHSDDLFGPWQPHAQNPVLIDTGSARPAGNFQHQDGRLFRPVQDCTKSYGAGLNLVEVTKLTPDDYEQEIVTRLGPDTHWPGRKFHMLNRAGNLEVIDGAILRPRLPWLRRLAEKLYKPA